MLRSCVADSQACGIETGYHRSLQNMRGDETHCRERGRGCSAHHDEDGDGVRLELGVVLQGRVAGVAQEGEHLLGARRDLKDPFFIWHLVRSDKMAVGSVLDKYMIVICNEHGTIYAISSDFDDRITTQSM